jgi:predicted RNase H-like nuclease (RuvC/YqgF family)
MSQDSVGLAALEQQVSRVASELERLRARNRELEAEVERLAGEIETAPTADRGSEDRSWIEERESLKARVTELVTTLEALLGTGDAGPV